MWLRRKVKVGDIHPGPDGTEFIVVSVRGKRVSRVMRNMREQTIDWIDFKQRRG
jgi:hypothetical protein